MASAIMANWEHVTAVLDRRTHLSPNDWFPKHGVEVTAPLCNMSFQT